MQKIRPWCKKSLFLALLLSFFQPSDTSAQWNRPYQSPTLQIIPLSPNTFLHRSYLETESYGKVACNGVVFISQKEAIVLDTPTDIHASRELINWIRNHENVQIKGLIVNHFHIDCLGGLAEFNAQGIPTFAHQKTADLLNEPERTPKHLFEGKMTLAVGEGQIVNGYFGEAHTADNIFTYIPSEGLLFGGCAVKSLGAQKGNLEDANVNEWSSTLRRVRTRYPNPKIVVPGHGDPGNIDLLDYTIALFNTE